MLSWLRLANLQLPARLANALLDRYGSPDALFAASPTAAETAEALAEMPGAAERFAGRIWDLTYSPAQAQLDALEADGIWLLTRGAPDYPRNLLEIPDPPAVLFVRGRLDERDRFAVALVGSRLATPYGRGVTARLARDLVAAGLTVVSGGALGIDAAAHDAAFEAGGRTLVVLGCGLDVDYPKENRRLFDGIVEQDRGALITEFPMGAAPEPWRFPMRNRIISGLAAGVVVIEAGAQSGSLITASNAAEQGRDVMAVPGNVDRPGSKGTNALIRDGAILVEDARDVLRALNMLVLEPPKEAAAAGIGAATAGPGGRPAIAPNLPENQRRILEFLNLTPRHVDALSADTRLPTTQVSVELTLLELSGLVRRLPGNCYIRLL